MTRRDFSIFSVGVLGMAGLGGWGLQKMSPKTHLRPPGAVKHFESLCIKCGQCVQVCPYHSIKLLGLDDGLNLGSAYIDASERGCYLCDLFPCVLACPSGALDHNTSEIKDAKMGVAFVKNPNLCYANLNKSVEMSDISNLIKREPKNERESAEIQKIKSNLGEICSLCVGSCPVGGAIEMVKFNENLLPQINADCVGCGVCQEVCFAGVIEIIPNKTYNQIYEGNE